MKNLITIDTNTNIRLTIIEMSWITRNPIIVYRSKATEVVSNTDQLITANTDTNRTE